MAMALCWCQTGCALRRTQGPGQEGRERRALYERHRAVELDLPPLRSPSPRCGAACAAMVTAFHGRALTVDDVALAVGEPAGRGVSNRALAAYLRRHGFECYNINGTTDDLQRFLDRRLPPVLVVGSSGGRGFHYLVVVGIAPEAGLVLVNNPFCGRELLTLDELDQRWLATGRTLLVIAPRTPPSPPRGSAVE